MLIKYPNYYL